MLSQSALQTRFHCYYPEPVAIQLQSSGNPVYTGMQLKTELQVASVFPVVFQWPSSGFPVCSNYAINTGLPLGYHWLLTSASVVPVARQCTCGSCGLPVCSNYANYHWIAIGRQLGDSISQCDSSVVCPVVSLDWILRTNCFFLNHMPGKWTYIRETWVKSAAPNTTMTISYRA